VGITNTNYYQSILVDCGTNGGILGGGIIEYLLYKLKHKSLSIPNPDSELNETKLPLVFIRYVFSFREDFMKPYD
jgi:hypothetical protein